MSNVAVLEFLTATVTSRGWDAPPHHWDFITISLCSLLASVRKSLAAWGSTKVPSHCAWSTPVLPWRCWIPYATSCVISKIEIVCMCDVTYAPCSPQVSLLSRAALRLWAAVARFVSAVPRESERRQPAAHVADLLTEWRDIFQPDTTYNLLYIIMHALGN